MVNESEAVLLGTDANKGYLYRCAPMIRYPLGNAFELVYLPLTGAAHVLAAREVTAACCCTGFQPLNRHADTIASHCPNGPAASDIPGVLTDLAGAGVMVSYQNILSRITEKASGQEDEKGVEWLAIPTCKRPGELARALRSYAINAERFGRRCRVFIADDSSSADQRAKTTEAIAAVTSGSAIEAWYAGIDEKLRFAESLAEGGEIPPDVIRFALFGAASAEPTMGANRNAILLGTVGTKILSVDDDTICHPACPPEIPDVPGVTLGSHGDPTEFWFFQNREAALRYPSPPAIDVVAEHERFLGRTISAVLNRAAAEGIALDLDHACTHLLEDACSGTGTIVLTFNGTVGDSGIYSGQRLPEHTGQGTRERLLKSEQDYRNACTSREVIHQTLSHTVSHLTSCMATFIGIDNRALLPPFFPVCRNEDGVFGRTLAKCTEHIYAGYLPWSLVHAPAASRSYNRAGVTRIRASDILVACMSTWSGSLATPAEKKLRSLGLHLSDLGKLPASDFQACIRSVLWRDASNIIAQQEALLKRYSSSPDYWAADLQGRIDTLRGAVVDPDYLVPVDLLDHASREQALVLIQRWVAQFGDLLPWWPAIVERAMTLRNEGRGLGRRVQTGHCSLRHEGIG